MEALFLCLVVNNTIHRSLVLVNNEKKRRDESRLYKFGYRRESNQ